MAGKIRITNSIRFRIGVLVRIESLPVASHFSTHCIPLLHPSIFHALLSCLFISNGAFMIKINPCVMRTLCSAMSQSACTHSLIGTSDSSHECNNIFQCSAPRRVFLAHCVTMWFVSQNHYVSFISHFVGSFLFSCFLYTSDHCDCDVGEEIWKELGRMHGSLSLFTGQQQQELLHFKQRRLQCKNYVLSRQANYVMCNRA